MRRAGMLALAAALCAGALTRADELMDQTPSSFATLDGIRIHYKSRGAGSQAVVFVHGWSCDMSFWRFQVPALAGKIRVILVDLPGHGMSDKPEIEYTQDLFARSLDAVLRAAGVERAVLVGHSNGTHTVRQFWRLYPAKTQALVAVDGNLRPFWKSPAQFESFVGRFRGPDYKQRAAELIDAMTAPSLPGLRQGIKASMLSTPQHVMLSSFEGTGDERLWKEETIGVPLLVVLAQSPSWSAEYEAFVRRLAPGVEYHVMDGVSHFLMMDKPDEFNALLGAFLAKQGLLKK